MRKHHLSVTSLEEYEPNREFVGRNFNAGEVIQLVLRSRQTGRWLPFNYVQMVMMHELAHCKQMNHSRAFWAVRNQYAEQMYELWNAGYLGDGIWGRGANLGTGDWEHRQVCTDETPAQHLCGGTYRSRRRRKRRKNNPADKEALTHRERQERRVLKKFGRNGTAVGADQNERARLEGKIVKGRPRVAGSARGRELRAAAALARFGKLKEEEQAEKSVDKEESDSESEDGSNMLDGNGRTMIKVCEDEDVNDADVKTELSQLRIMFRPPANYIKKEETDDDVRMPPPPPQPLPRLKKESAERSSCIDYGSADSVQPVNAVPEETDASKSCSVCSFANSSVASTCGVCANVLNPQSTPAWWQCPQAACNRSYKNSRDCGVCGLCGQRRGAEL